METSDSIFLVSDGGGLVEMRAERYDSEDRLQALLANYPDLLAGSQMSPGAGRRWMLVRREAGIPSREGGSDQWSADHLFLDQDGVPTIVEVKRSTNREIRRSVVGQMLDYAANAVRYWPAERLRADHEAFCRQEGRPPEAALAELLGGDADPDAFWVRVGEHLAAGRVRMVFVADEIPPELQRIVEFLNEQLRHAEVFAVEVRQYVGPGHRSLVPRLVGATAAAQQAKGRSPTAGPGYEALLAGADTLVRTVAARMEAWTAARGGTTKTTPAGRQWRTAGGRALAQLYPAWGTLELYLGALHDAGLDVEADGLQAELASLTAAGKTSDRHPNIPCADIAADWDRFEVVLDRYAAAFNRTDPTGSGESGPL